MKILVSERKSRWASSVSRNDGLFAFELCAGKGVSDSCICAQSWLIIDCLLYLLAVASSLIFTVEN